MKPAQSEAAVTLHTLSQSLAVASLSVDAASAYLDRGDLSQARQCLDAAAAALEDAGDWMARRRAMDSAPADAEP